MSLLVAILAAGQASRFGGGKLDAICAGKPLGHWALDAVAAAGLVPGVIIVPAGDDPQFARTSGWTLLTNPDAAEGLGTSVALAAREALERGCDLLILLADMPLITPEHLRALARQSGLAATCHGEGRPGVPAFIPHRLLDEVAGLSGESGAGRWLAVREDCALLVAQEGTLFDIDRAEDLAQAEALLLSRSPGERNGFTNRG